MRTLALGCVVLCFGAGCKHSRSALDCESTRSEIIQPSRSPEIGEERCNPDGSTAAPAPPGSCASPESGSCVVAGPEAPGPADRPQAKHRFGLTRLLQPKEKVTEIRVNVPPPQVIIRREEKPKAEQPPPASAPRPGAEVLLVPRLVYVPYTQTAPTGPVTMVPPPQPCPPPVTACPPPTQSCPPPTQGPCPPNMCTPTPGLGSRTGANPPTLEDLNRRCVDLETKIDALLNALNKTR